MELSTLFMSILTENIKNLRLLNGLTQKELATKIECSSSTLSNWEKGDCSPTGDYILRLCDVFECNPNQLFGFEKMHELEIYKVKRNDTIKEIEKMQKERSALDAKIKAFQRILSQKQG